MCVRVRVCVCVCVCVKATTSTRPLTTKHSTALIVSLYWSTEKKIDAQFEMQMSVLTGEKDQEKGVAVLNMRNFSRLTTQYEYTLHKK